MANLQNQAGNDQPNGIAPLAFGDRRRNSCFWLRPATACTPPRRRRCRGQSPLPPAGENVAAASVEGEMIAEVRVVGNKSMPLEKITPHIRTRAGRPFSMQQLQEDARSLDNTRMFVSVKTYTQRVPSGIVVIFDVLERPMLMDVKFIGNVKINRKALQKEAKVKVGDPVDPFAIEESRRTLEEYYHGKGYDKARITLLEGDKAEDRRAVYLINEGVKQKVQYRQVRGQHDRQRRPAANANRNRTSHSLSVQGRTRPQKARRRRREADGLLPRAWASSAPASAAKSASSIPAKTAIPRRCSRASPANSTSSKRPIGWW